VRLQNGLGKGLG